MLGVSPTLIRTLKGSDLDRIHERDLSSVHVLGSTGEPWDPGSYDWLARLVFGERVPVINFSGGTEVGGSFLAPYPVEPIRSCSLGGPSLGMDVDVVDDDGRSVRGQVGELVCRQPWPSMTRGGVWKDDQRYLDAYWSRFPGLWHHGDFAMVDAEGQWFILGRSDDVMNVAGKRLAPGRGRGRPVNHPAVSEAAAVGVPDPVKGEAVWAFWVARTPTSVDETAVSRELKQIVGKELGKPFAPSKVWRVDALPKTRSAKILRRAIRAAALGTDPGDLSGGAENPRSDRPHPRRGARSVVDGIHGRRRIADGNRVALINLERRRRIGMHVPSHPAAGSFGVPLPNRTGDRLVRPRSHFTHCGIDEGGVLGAGVDGLRERRHEADEKFVVTGHRDADVPVDVGLQKPGQVGLRVGDSLVGPVQRLEVLLAPLHRREFGAVRLEGLTGFHQVGQLDLPSADQHADRVGHRGRAGTLDEGSACPAGLDPNQVLDLQNPQRLAHRRPAHLSLLDQLPLSGKGGAFREFAAQDALPQLPGENIRRLGNVDGGAERDRRTGRCLALHKPPQTH